MSAFIFNVRDMYALFYDDSYIIIEFMYDSLKLSYGEFDIYKCFIINNDNSYTSKKGILSVSKHTNSCSIEIIEKGENFPNSVFIVRDIMEYTEFLEKNFSALCKFKNAAAAAEDEA